MMELHPGCCSAVSPCEHQLMDPTTICAVCREAANQYWVERRPLSKQIDFSTVVDNMASFYKSVEKDASMAKDVSPMRSFTVCSAKSGGFYVMNPWASGELSPVLYAGTLDDCLDFIRREMTYPEEMI